MSVLLYLNNDFDGGETTFYDSLLESPDVASVKLAVKPVQGAVLLIPQAAENKIDDARSQWSTHEGSSLTTNGRGKYVLRTDLLFPQEDDATGLRRAFMDDLRSRRFPSLAFTQKARELYSPYFGVENAGALLYSIVRFLKPRSIAEVGSGYTTLFLLQALKDNEAEADALADGKREHKNYDMLGTDWYTSSNHFSSSEEETPPKLVCVDDLSHQVETASRAETLAVELRLDKYLAPVQNCDAFDATFPPSSLDLFWLDFGVGDRLAEYLGTVILPALRLGGFVAIHSSVTNLATRKILDDLIRDPTSDLAQAYDLNHISLLEPHKRFQNSITLLQKRRQPKHPRGGFEWVPLENYEEPLFSTRP